MPRTIRFHLDEHCNPAIAAGLRRHGINVTTTADAGLLSAPDEEHAAYALSQTRVIFTQDKDFLRRHDAGIPHAGIVYCRQQSRTIGQIIEGLRLIWELFEPDEMRGRVEYLPRV
jgi:predicted nuclease of predicted toxin-antitoxin system